MIIPLIRAGLNTEKETKRMRDSTGGKYMPALDDDDVLLYSQH